MHDRSADRALGAPPATAPRAATRRRAAALLLGVLTLVGLGVSTVQYIDARRIERTAADATAVADADTDRAAAELDDQRAELAGAELALGAAEAGLAASVRDLHARLGDRHALTAQVEGLRAHLVQLQGAITGTQSESTAAAGLAATLAACLDGVTELLNQVSVGDDAGAARTADRIGPACAAVGTVLG